MTKTRIHALAIVVVLASVLSPALAGAQTASDYARREAVAAEKARKTAQIDVLRVDDKELEGAVQALDASIRVQQSDTDAAQQAAVSAQTTLGAAEARLAATERLVAELQSKVSSVAIRSYMNPGSLGFLDMVKARDFSEASRRQTLLSHVVSHERDVLGALRAARQDLQAEQDNLEALRDQAQKQRLEAAAKLEELRSARSDQARLRGALDVRIKAFTAEVEALAREEAYIVSLIQGRTAEVAASAAPTRVSGSGMVWPASGPVTSGFGMRWGRMHTGIDIGAGYGAPIRAAKAGTVILASYNGGYGLTVIIDHGGGLTTLAAHQSRTTVRDGQRVSQGDVVGYVGTSGNSTGAHLHFETRLNGTAQNPLRYLP